MMGTWMPETSREENCAPTWIYLRDYTGMYCQKNIEHCILNFILNGTHGNVQTVNKFKCDRAPSESTRRGFVIYCA